MNISKRRQLETLLNQLPGHSCSYIKQNDLGDITAYTIGDTKLFFIRSGGQVEFGRCTAYTETMYRFLEEQGYTDITLD